jgi:NAD(P)-dependent dehydrogenase (short-subunit alcohol dehydrogenase family)
MPRYDLRGKVVLITGGAQGIGLATARLAAQRGARVALLDRDGEAADRAARGIGADRAVRATGGEQAIALAADVTDPDALAAAVAATADRLGGIDVAIANAGIPPPPRTVRSIDRADFERVVDVNLHGVWHTVRETLPHVVARRGQLVLVSSIYAALTGVLAAPYAASKAAVEQLGRALRVELAAHETTASVAYFGFVQTGLVGKAFAPREAELLRAALPGWLTNPIPVERAAEAMIRGLERRATRIAAPRWVPALLAARGLLSALDARLARDDDVRAAIESAESHMSGL